MSKTKTKVRKRGERTRVQTQVQGDSLTRQSEADAANINNIVSKALQTGFLPVRSATPFTGEAPSVESFHEAMNIVAKAKENFENLPVDIRNAFKNDPANMLDAIEKSKDDEELKESLIKAGVLNGPEPEETPLKVEVTNQPEEKAVDKTE